LSLTTILLLSATYVPLRIFSPQQLIPLLGSLLLFGATHHTLLNPTTLTDAILTLFYTQPALQQYIDPTPIALNLCTGDPILAIFPADFHQWMPPSIPTLNSGPHKRLVLFMLVLLLLVTPVEISI
jgi:hypothetical protein